VAGWLIPLWGMEAIERRLNELVEQYEPARLILAGDIVHSTVAKRQAESLITRLSRLGSELTLIRGNHDLGLSGLPLLDQVSVDEFRFHHGHLDLAPESSIRDVVGHVHPSWIFNDGAGSRFRRPAMIQTANRFILPAFSPWAAGARFEIREPHRIWVCGKNRILRLEVPEPSIP
jgi:metallophosphoesterase superfamily enzyme